MEIVIAFPERRAGGRDYWEKNGGRCELGRDVGEGEEAVFEDCIEDAELVQSA